jgi:hypothetical protein
MVLLLLLLPATTSLPKYLIIPVSKSVENLTAAAGLCRPTTAWASRLLPGHHAAAATKAAAAAVVDQADITVTSAQATPAAAPTSAQETPAAAPADSSLVERTSAAAILAWPSAAHSTLQVGNMSCAMMIVNSRNR